LPIHARRIAQDFWKLHRIIDDPLPAGTYNMTVRLNFPVASFGGTKGIALSNATPAGTQGIFLGFRARAVKLNSI
jgi:hypothetical protein